MKNVILFLVLFQVTFFSAQSSKGIFGSSNWFKNWTNFKSKTTDYRDAEDTLTGVIDKNTVLNRNKNYLLVGNVYVVNGAVLTIESGTLIRGDFETNGSLIIAKGSKIIAKGEDVNPIVFTSNKPSSERKAGDWGGIVVMGDAPINKFSGRLDSNLDPNYNLYGGNNVDSNSGILKYVRIEFAGKKGKHSKNFDALCLAGIGKKTVLEYVQVSFSAGNSFQFYGGDIVTTNLVSFKSINDDFNFSEGAQCKIDNSVAIRSSYVTGVSGSRAIQVDSYDVASNVDLGKKTTKVEANFITLVNDNNIVSNVENEAIYFGERATFRIKNSVISGFKKGVVLSSKIKKNVEDVNLFEFQNVLFNNCGSNFISEHIEYETIVATLLNNKKNSFENSETDESKLFIESDLKKTPDYRLLSDVVIVDKSN